MPYEAQIIADYIVWEPVAWSLMFHKGPVTFLSYLVTCTFLWFYTIYQQRYSCANFSISQSCGNTKYDNLVTTTFHQCFITSSEFPIQENSFLARFFALYGQGIDVVFPTLFKVIPSVFVRHHPSPITPPVKNCSSLSSLFLCLSARSHAPSTDTLTQPHLHCCLFPLLLLMLNISTTYVCVQWHTTGVLVVNPTCQPEPEIEQQLLSPLLMGTLSNILQRSPKRDI